MASSNTSSSVGAGTSKTLDKLERSVQSGNFYEAQQMYKTIYARYMGSKKYTEALDLLQSGACVQLRHGQFTCGIELAMLLIDVFSAAKIEYDESSLDRIKCIYMELPRTSKRFSAEGEEDAMTKTRLEGVQAFMKAAIKWSSERGGPSKGSRQLHDLLADYLWTESPKPDLSKVSYHFVRGTSPANFERAVVGTISQLEPESRDLILARGVLLCVSVVRIPPFIPVVVSLIRYLSLGNLRDANKLFEGAEARLKQSGFSDVLSSPLIHFTRFLLLTLERDAIPLFRTLRENYKSSIERDPSLDELLDVVGEKFYGLRRRNGLQGMFGDFMRMFSDAGRIC